MDDAKVVELRNVSLMLGQRRILRDISWAVRKGEHWALLGPNGSGKTTLLRLINGYLWPTLGRASVLGRPFGSCDLRELRKSIGFVSPFISEQIPAELKVLDVVLTGGFASIGLFASSSKTEIDRAKKLLKFFGCGRLLNSRYVTLSQGERQRVSIARALMCSPRLLTLDEPCSGLDLTAREVLLGLLQKIGRMRRGPTMIFATHRVEEIMPTFAHAMIIKSGQVVRSGPKSFVMMSKTINSAFSTNSRLLKRNGRYSLSMA